MESLSENKKYKIILSGGGTAGSVTPLLAMAAHLPAEAELVFFGTSDGPERQLLEECNKQGRAWRFVVCPAAKWRRYFSWKNLWDLLRLPSIFIRCFFLLKKERADIMITAGSFVSVPLAWAAFCLRLPFIVHQQDLRPGLANCLMAPFASLITVAFEKSLDDYGICASWIGNPEPERPSLEKYSLADFSLEEDRPLLLVTGGGNGAAAINEIIAASREALISKCQIFHLAGRGKLSAPLLSDESYQEREFIDNSSLLFLMSRADLVVSRAGLGTITELASLAKASIIIPIPDSHQEDNAAFLAYKGAALVLSQKELTPEKFQQAVFELLSSAKQRQLLADNISHLLKPKAAETLADLSLKLIDKNRKK